MKFKIIILSTLIVLLFNSCGFYLYNYRGFINTNISIPNNQSDTNMRYIVGQLIYRQSFKSNLYTRFATKTYDSLFFYGPDYHTLRFKIIDSVKTTKIHFTYSGYNGWRGRPPHKIFISSFRDSLKNKFGATETIILDISNEKKRKTAPNST